MELICCSDDSLCCVFAPVEFCICIFLKSSKTSLHSPKELFIFIKYRFLCHAVFYLMSYSQGVWFYNMPAFHWGMTSVGYEDVKSTQLANVYKSPFFSLCKQRSLCNQKDRDHCVIKNEVLVKFSGFYLVYTIYFKTTNILLDYSFLFFF